MLLHAVRSGRARMMEVCVYRGYGANDKGAAILHRELTRHLQGSPYTVSYISPEQICQGKLQTNVKLLAIGGGFDLGLIKALQQPGMTQIRDFVTAGGRYLGICSGAYFACEYIEFDKGGPLQVKGERFLKFYPGVSCGPLYKKYVYNSCEGAVVALIDFPMLDGAVATTEHVQAHAENPATGQALASESPDDPAIDQGVQNSCNSRNECAIKTDKLNSGQDYENSYECSSSETNKRGKIDAVHGCIQANIYFNGGGHFVQQTMKSYLQPECVKNLSAKRQKTEADKTNSAKSDTDFDKTAESGSMAADDDFKKVTVLSRYLDLPGEPVAMVKCQVGRGVAVLSGGHFEYTAEDIEGEGEGSAIQTLAEDVRTCSADRDTIFASVLKLLLNGHTKYSSL